MWTDASSTYGLGGYILEALVSALGNWPHIYVAVPTRHAIKDDIQFMEMLAVKFALKRWLPQLAGSRIAIHCNNAAAVSGLKKSTIHSPAMSLLRQLTLLFAMHDIVVVPI
jgi:hypothetical protein